MPPVSPHGGVKVIEPQETQFVMAPPLKPRAATASRPRPRSMAGWKGPLRRRGWTKIRLTMKNDAGWRPPIIS